MEAIPNYTWHLLAVIGAIYALFLFEMILLMLGNQDNHGSGDSGHGHSHIPQFIPSPQGNFKQKTESKEMLVNKRAVFLSMVTLYFSNHTPFIQLIQNISPIRNIYIIVLSFQAINNSTVSVNVDSSPDIKDDVPALTGSKLLCGSMYYVNNTENLYPFETINANFN